MSAVLDLYDLGYQMVPLPARKKNPPPVGTTGYRGVPLTRAVVERYASMTTQAQAWAIRHDDLTVGIDNDAYKDNGAAFRDLIAQFGPLPATVRSTARTDESSGIYLFRLPAPTFLKSNPADTIEMIQNHHRFSIVAPSTHTKLGDPYRFIDGSTGDVVGLPPAPCDLPLLPATWIERLKANGKKGRNAERIATADEMAAFVDAHTDARAPRLLGKPEHRLYRSGVGSRHDTLLEVACWTMREAAAGLYAAGDALTLIEDWWAEVMDDADRRNGDELPSAIAWAIAEVEANPKCVAEARRRFDNWVTADAQRKRDEMSAWLAGCSK